MGRSRRFLLLPLAVILVFLLLRDGGPDPEYVSHSHSNSQIQTQRDEDRVRRPSPYGSGEKRPHGLPPGGTAKRAGPWTDALTRLEILVVDEETQVPLPEATVQITEVWSPSRKLSGQTGPDGRASFELDRGQYWLWADHPEYVSDNAGFAAEGSMAQRTIVLTPGDPPGFRVTGSVHDEAGRVVPGVIVSLGTQLKRGKRPFWPLRRPVHIPFRDWNRLVRSMAIPSHAETDQNGVFSLEAPEGTYELHVFSLTHQHYEDAVQVPTPGPLEIVLAEWDELVRLSGRVSDGEGLPLAGASVKLGVSTKSGPLGRAGATTGSDGHFEFIFPPGVATLEVEFKDHKTYWQTHEVTQDTKIFPVLQRYKKYRSFTVQVYDGKGRIVADPFVIGTALESGKGVVSPVAGNIDRSKSPQTYHATEYPFRIYATALHLGRGITEAKVIRSYQANIDLRVRGGGRVEGNVADSDRIPVRDFTIVLRKDGFDLGIFRSFSQEGRFSLEEIPPGLYSLSFHSRPELDRTQEPGRTQPEMETVRPKLVMIQNDRTSFLDVVLRPQGWVKTAGQRSGGLDPDAEPRPEY